MKRFLLVIATLLSLTVLLAACKKKDAAKTHSQRPCCYASIIRGAPGKCKWQSDETNPEFSVEIWQHCELCARDGLWYNL